MFSTGFPLIQCFSTFISLSAPKEPFKTYFFFFTSPHEILIPQKHHAMVYVLFIHHCFHIKKGSIFSPPRTTFCPPERSITPLESARSHSFAQSNMQQGCT